MKSWGRATILLFVLAGVFRLLLVDNYGYSWDERIRQGQGERKLEHYLHLLQPDSQDEERAKPDHYPGFFDLNLAFLRRVSPFDPILTGHLFSTFLGWLATGIACLIACRFSGPRAAFFTMVLLLLLPRWWGHWSINPKDIPFAFAYLLTILAFLHYRGDIHSSRDRKTTPWLLGIALGILLSTRLAGGILFALFPLIWISKPHPISGRLKECLLVGVISVSILLFYWPYAQTRFFEASVGTLKASASFDWSQPVFYLGQYVSAENLPRVYPLVVFLLTTPVAHLLFLATLLFAIFKKKRKLDFSLLRKAPDSLLLTAAAFLPIAALIILKPTLYNGIRHLLFLLPLFCIFLGTGLDRHLDFLLQRPLPRISLLTGVIFLAIPAWQMQRLHPYEYAHYNSIAGTTAGAGGWMETDYWATAYRELTEGWVLWLDAQEFPEGTEFLVSMEHPTWLVSPFLPTNKPYKIRLRRSAGPSADFYLASTQWQADQFWAGQTIHQIERMGIPLAVVKDRRQLQGEERAKFYGTE